MVPHRAPVPNRNFRIVKPAEEIVYQPPQKEKSLQDLFDEIQAKIDDGSYKDQQEQERHFLPFVQQMNEKPVPKAYIPFVNSQKQQAYDRQYDNWRAMPQRFQRPDQAWSDAYDRAMHRHYSQRQFDIMREKEQESRRWTMHEKKVFKRTGRKPIIQLRLDDYVSTKPQQKKK